MTAILITLGAWVVWTFIIIVVGRSLKKRGWFYAGVLALLGTVLGVSGVYLFFGAALRCQEPSCWGDKAIVDTLLQFVLITWGAMGGASLARAVDEK
jgi:ATP/ADP translocase